MTAAALARIDERAEAQLFRQVMGRFATGVTVVTTRLNGETFGMTANAFMAGSLEPMLCVVSISRTAQMHGRLQAAGHYGVGWRRISCSAAARLFSSAPQRPSRPTSSTPRSAATTHCS
jgi:flavin reductase (DIM6/NTAB) family NADH-FMN oxidoreductase RutF